MCWRISRVLVNKQLPSPVLGSVSSATQSWGCCLAGGPSSHGDWVCLSHSMWTVCMCANRKDDVYYMLYCIILLYCIMHMLRAEGWVGWFAGVIQKFPPSKWHTQFLTVLKGAASSQSKLCLPASLPGLCVWAPCCAPHPAQKWPPLRPPWTSSSEPLARLLTTLSQLHFHYSAQCYQQVRCFVSSVSPLPATRMLDIDGI